MPAPLFFLPRPRSVEMGEGAFELDAGVSLTGSAERDAGSETLRRAIGELFGIHLESDGQRNAIELRLGHDGPPQSYEIEITPERVEVRAADAAGLFYAAQTLIQVSQNTGRFWPSMLICDEPALPNRGVMLDVSRGKVPKLETLLRLTEMLAHYKFNQFQLYFEHTFAFPSHPEISSGADPLTPEDIRALDRHCRRFHIDLIPNLQSIGHLRPLLSLPQFQHLAETPWHWSFATSSDEGFTLLDALYGEMMPAFSSDKFNVNADEPWDFGRGQSSERAREVGLGRLYLEHIKRLHQLVGGRGKRMAMWADMFWHYPELVSELPDDILLFDWWYERKPSYDTVNVLKAAGREFYVCPATSSWSTLFPRMENAISNIRDFTRAGVAAGASGMIVTDWGDNGHFQPLSNSWHAYLTAADAGWTGATTPMNEVDAAIGLLFLRDASGKQIAAIRRLGAAMQVAPDWFTSWHSAMALFEDPLVGKMAALSPQSVVQEAREAALAVQRLLDQVQNDGLRHDLGFVTAAIALATEKVETTRAIHRWLRGAAIGDATDGSAEHLGCLVATLRSQERRFANLKREFEARWLAEARRSEIQQNLNRYEKLAERYAAAISWLEDQGRRHAAGDSIDVDMSTYDRGDYAVLHEATRRQIKELVDIVGIESIPPDLLPWIDQPEVMESKGKA